MARRRSKSEDDPIWQFVSSVFVLYAVYLTLLWHTNKPDFWRWFWYGIAVAVVILGGFFAWLELRYRMRQRRMNRLLSTLHRAGLEEHVKNFIDRFSNEKKRGNIWTYRDHSFDLERLRDFRKFLNERGIRLSIDKWDDTFSLLRYYIQQKEERLTRESIGLSPKKFSDLSGPEFENLLYRLFEAIGYAVQKIGNVGDQGGDLIANLSGQRIVIQAKRYAGTVGNDAVQEAVAAQKFYDCNRAMVVTNSSFTREAYELAKANNVELISGEKLSTLLLQYLKESWS